AQLTTRLRPPSTHHQPVDSLEFVGSVVVPSGQLALPLGHTRMPASRLGGARMLLSPREPLVAGGAAEAFERQLQQLIRAGYRNLVVDLAAVEAIDSAGIRALVRAHTSARRVDGTLRLAGARRRVSEVIDLSHLGGIFQIYDSVDAAKIAAWPW